MEKWKLYKFDLSKYNYDIKEGFLYISPTLNILENNTISTAKVQIITISDIIYRDTKIVYSGKKKFTAILKFLLDMLNITDINLFKNYARSLIITTPFTEKGFINLYKNGNFVFSIQLNSSDSAYEDILTIKKKFMIFSISYKTPNGEIKNI